MQRFLDEQHRVKRWSRDTDVPVNCAVSSAQRTALETARFGSARQRRNRMMTMRSKLTVFAATCALAVPVAAAPAEAQQEGLVNVNVGDVTVLQDVNVAAAVGVVAQVCGV